MKTGAMDFQNMDDPNLSAARTLLRAAGHDDDAIDRAFLALQEGEGHAQAVPEDDLLSAREVCDWLGISLSTLWRWRIPHVRAGGLRRFYRHDVEKFLNQRYVRATS